MRKCSKDFACRGLLGHRDSQGRQVHADFPVSQDQEASKVNRHLGDQERKARRENLGCLEWMVLLEYLVNRDCQV